MKVELKTNRHMGAAEKGTAEEMLELHRGPPSSLTNVLLLNGIH